MLPVSPLVLGCWDVGSLRVPSHAEPSLPRLASLLALPSVDEAGSPERLGSFLCLDLNLKSV